MDNNTLIQIITKNNPTKVERLLTSIKENSSLRASKVLLVDDSTEQTIVNKSSAIIAESGLEVLHVDYSRWELYKEKLLGVLDSSFINGTELGLETWNTPNVRNVGLILMSALYANKGILKIIHFDDDIVVSGLNYSSKRVKSSIEGIKIGGCPDLSRFEWIQLFIRVSLLDNGKQVGFADDSYEYANELANVFSLNELKSAINKFTNFRIDTSSFEDGEILRVIPSREEFSGGAYINEIGNLGLGVFPNVYNEDWCYVNMVRKSLGQGNSFYNSGSVEHSSSKKDILNAEELMKEELGEFFQIYYRLGSKSDYMKIVDYKIELIKKEIEQCQKLEGIGINESKLIVDLLILLMNFYVGLKTDISVVDSIMSKFVMDNSEWKSFYNKLAGIIN